jgi:hypothetical protein
MAQRNVAGSCASVRGTHTVVVLPWTKLARCGVLARPKWLVALAPDESRGTSERPGATRRDAARTAERGQLMASKAFVTASLIALSSLALTFRESLAQQQPNGDCKCPTIQARSTPIDAKDICTEGETAGRCSLKWNAPPGRTQSDFMEGVKSLRPSPICSWIDFLKQDGYQQKPESAAVGFVLLLSAGLAELNSPDRAKAVLEEVRSMESRQLVGRALIGGARYIKQQQTYVFTAAPGCVEARSITGPPLVVVIQNLRSRNGGACVPQ